MCQGFTFPVVEYFLEYVLEKTRYSIKSEFDNFEGNSRRKRKQQDSKKDPLTEMFEACIFWPIHPCIYSLCDLYGNLIWTMNSFSFTILGSCYMELELKSHVSTDFFLFLGRILCSMPMFCIQFMVVAVLIWCWDKKLFFLRTISGRLCNESSS